MKVHHLGNLNTVISCLKDAGVSFNLIYYNFSHENNL